MASEALSKLQIQSLCTVLINHLVFNSEKHECRYKIVLNQYKIIKDSNYSKMSK